MEEDYEIRITITSLQLSVTDRAKLSGETREA